MWWLKLLTQWLRQSVCFANILYYHWYHYYWSFSGGLDSKESARNAGDLGSVPGLGRSSGGGNGNPLQYSCLENFMDRGAWRATVHGITKSWTWLSNTHTHTHTLLLIVKVALELGYILQQWCGCGASRKGSNVSFS